MSFSVNSANSVAQNDRFILTTEIIEKYKQDVIDRGITRKTAAHYANALQKLYKWLPQDKAVTPSRLPEWRLWLAECGYNEKSVRDSVTYVNTFFKALNRADLCIPKPLRVDLTGKQFGYLTVIEPTPKRQSKEIVWRCLCRCGNETEVVGSALTTGNTTSCGCRRKEWLSHTNRYVENTSLRQAMENKPLSDIAASGYTGVYPLKDKWIAVIIYKKVQRRIGVFDNLEDAVAARAKAKQLVMEDAEELNRTYAALYDEQPTLPPYIKEDYRPKKSPCKSSKAMQSNNTSGCTGVRLTYGKWESSITHKKKLYRFGVFENIEDAVAARKQAEYLIAKNDLEQLLAMCVTKEKR